MLNLKSHAFQQTKLGKSGQVWFTEGCREDRSWQVWRFAAHSPVSWNTVASLSQTASNCVCPRVYFMCPFVCICVCMSSLCCVAVVSPGAILLPCGMRRSMDPLQSLSTYTSTQTHTDSGSMGVSIKIKSFNLPSPTIQKLFNTCIRREREGPPCIQSYLENTLRSHKPQWRSKVEVLTCISVVTLIWEMSVTSHEVYNGVSIFQQNKSVY